MINSDLKQLVDKIDYLFYVKSRDVTDYVLWANDFTLRLVGASSVDELNAKLKDVEFGFQFLFENDVKIRDAVSRLYYFSKASKEDKLLRQRTFFLTKIPDLTNDVLVCFGNEITDSLTSITRVDFFRQLLNSTNDALVLTEIEHPFKILFANKGFLKLSGYPNLEDVLGKSPTELVGKAEADQEIRDVFNESLRKNRSAFAIFENYKRNDKKYPYKNAVKVIPLFDQDNQLQYFLSIQEDVSEKERLKKQTQVQQNKLRAIFNATEGFLWLLDSKGKIVELNKTAKLQGRLSNGNTNFLDGRWWLSNDESKQKIDDALTSVIRKRKDVRLLVDLLLANDEIKIVDIAFRAIRSDSGALLFIVVEAYDVTELECQKQRAIDLAKKNSSISSQLTEKQIDQIVRGDIEATREDLIRLTKTETVLNQQVIPQLNQLTDVVLDPKEGLAVMAVQNAKSLSSIKDDMDGLKQMKEFADLGMTFLGWMKRPFVKWLIIAFAASMGFSSVKFLAGSVQDFVNWEMENQQLQKD